MMINVDEDYVVPNIAKDPLFSLDYRPSLDPRAGTSIMNST